MGHRDLWVFRSWIGPQKRVGHRPKSVKSHIAGMLRLICVIRKARTYHQTQPVLSCAQINFVSGETRCAELALAPTLYGEYSNIDDGTHFAQIVEVTN